MIRSIAAFQQVHALAGIMLAAFAATTPLAADDFPTPINTEKSTSSPLAPSEVVRTAKLPPGFRLSVVAAEPQVQNPIAITTDERGRVWVAENYSWAGAGAGGFDGNVRDRIVILEDSDGDGSYDKRTIFWDHARKLTSIEVGYGGVWAICLPQLLFFPDRNRDDVPDGPPEVVLDGFNEGAIGHTPANGLKWGPDGWLYGRHGILATSQIGKPGDSKDQRFAMNTGVWRYHPVRKVAEPVMHGMTNSWGFDFDANGEMFVINTVIGHLWHVLSGGHTERMFGQDLNAHVYHLLEQVADHVHWHTGEIWSDVRKGVTDRTITAGGGHAHIGLMIYQGDNWPAEYRNRVYTLNLHGLRINSDFLARRGAGFVATHGPDLAILSDPWFRGMDLVTGPDGGVLIADWSDTGECHDHDGVHRTSGRIYKLSYGDLAAQRPFDLQQKSNDELIALLSHANTWWARQARRLMTERALSMERPARESLQAQLAQRFFSTAERTTRLRLMETMAGVGSVPPSWWIQQLKSADESECVAALKFLFGQAVSSGRPADRVVTDAMTELAKDDPSGLVQLHVASLLQKLPPVDRWPMAVAMASRPDFANDRFLPLMIWYAIEAAVVENPELAVKLVERSRMPVLTECVARRLTEEIERRHDPVDALLASILGNEVPCERSAVHGMSLALNGWREAPLPERWAAVAERLETSTSETTRDEAQRLSLVFRDQRTLEKLRKLVEQRDAPADERCRALRALLSVRPAGYVPTLIALLDDSATSVEALRGLALYDEPKIPGEALSRLKNYPPPARAELIQTLAARPAWAHLLVDAIRDGRISPKELSAFHARQIQSLGDASLVSELESVWGKVAVSSAERRGQIDVRRTELTAERLSRADLTNGKAVFEKTCANCHVLFGAGRRVGPELTGSQRKNLNYLLENILDPGAVVGRDFRTVVIALSSGRVLNGVIREQNERTITLESAQETITVDRREIESMRTTETSLMPEGLLNNLSADQVRDLLGFLMSDDGQTASR